MSQKLTLRQQVNRVEKWFVKATEEDILQGRCWYENANAWASSFEGVSTEEVAHITAILSAQCDWETNKKNVSRFLSGDMGSIFATKKQLRECADVLDGWRIPPKRRKTHAFANTIVNPQTQELVVIDRHAIKVAYDQVKSDPIIVTDKRYRDAEKAYLIVADRCDFLGNQIQAITWLTYKRVVGR